MYGFNNGNIIAGNRAAVNIPAGEDADAGKKKGEAAGASPFPMDGFIRADQPLLPSSTSGTNQTPAPSSALVLTIIRIG